MIRLYFMDGITTTEFSQRVGNANIAAPNTTLFAMSAQIKGSELTLLPVPLLARKGSKAIYITFIIVCYRHFNCSKNVPTAYYFIHSSICIAISMILRQKKE